MTSPIEFIQAVYDQCMSIVGSDDFILSSISATEKSELDVILENSESKKAVLTVLITSLVYKSLNPGQDIRNHQDSIINGYSGRTFDNKYITPFLKKNRFPAMAESGWLTRSLEQKQPYTLTYTGAITPKELKNSFLRCIDRIQNGANCEDYLKYLFQGLIIKRNRQAIDLAKPTNLSINTILNLLDQHFNSKYKADGASRLPVLAFYAIYECLMRETKRFEHKKLLAIESHTSADSRSGRIGDIDVVDEKNRTFEAVEIKFGIPISIQLIQDAYSKFQMTPVNRFYILSTSPQPTREEWDEIQNEILKIKNVHGCQLIVNGIMPSLKYYLRLLENTFEFIENYVNLLKQDTALKFEHKYCWNRLIEDMK